MNKMDVTMLNAAIEANQAIRLHGKKVTKATFLDAEEGVEVEFIQKANTFVDDTDTAIITQDNPVWGGWMEKIGRRHTAVAIRMPENAPSKPTAGMNLGGLGGLDPEVARAVLQTILGDEEVRTAVKVLLVALAGCAGRQLDKATLAPPTAPRNGKTLPPEARAKAITELMELLQR